MKTISHRAAAALRRLLVGEPPQPSDRGGIDDLTSRVEHLEGALEGLQDAVYRQDDRQIADLRSRRPSGPAARSPALRDERS